MSTTAVKTWLQTRFTNSLKTAPGTYPQDGCAGVLNAIGWGTSKVTVQLDSPSKGLQLSTAASILLHDPMEEEKEKQGSGAYGTIKNMVHLEVEVYWYAKFFGDPAKSIVPVYTSEAASNKDFRIFLWGVKKTLRLAVYQKNGAGIYNGASWPINDPDTGENSIVLANQPLLKTYKEPPQTAENKTDLIYAALVQCSFMETFNDAGI